MPAPEVQGLNDYAVLWVKSTADSYGRYKVATPIEISVRWEDSRTEASDPQNTVQSHPAQVFVDRDIAIDSILWHGRLEDLPTTPTDLCKVTGFDATPDIKNRFTQRTATITRYGDKLPEVAL